MLILAVIVSAIHHGSRKCPRNVDTPDSTSPESGRRLRRLELLRAHYGGYVHAFDVTTGEKLWSYYLGDAGYDTPYGHYPLETPLVVADGKVYTSVGHGYSPPIFKGAKLLALDETDGSLIWDILFFGDRMGMAVADGYLISYNIYEWSSVLLR